MTSLADKRRLAKMYDFIETPTPTLCEYCRTRKVKTMTALHFGKKTRTIYTCAICNIRLTEEQQRYETDKAEARRAAAAKRRGA
jgi:hypothetical protein